MLKMYLCPGRPRSIASMWPCTMSLAATNSKPPGTYQCSLPLAKSQSVRPMRDGLKSLGPRIAQDVAITTGKPSAYAFRHSCSTAALDMPYGRHGSKGLKGTLSSLAWPG